MSVKVFVIFAVFALCNALTIPGTEESPDETNPIPLGETTIQQAPSTFHTTHFVIFSPRAIISSLI